MSRLFQSLVIAVLAVASAGTVTATAFAVAPTYGSSHLASTNCKGAKTPTTKVVDVNFRLSNDYDSGVAGNAWANDTIHRQLQIWQTSPTTFCAIVTDNGKISTFAGTSPAGAGTVTAGVEGTMSGGEVTGQFTGSLVPSPAYATSGNLGAFDENCSDVNTCPGAHPTISSYVSGYAGQLSWWGWQYATASHGTWTNAIDGNSGDITG